MVFEDIPPFLESSMKKKGEKAVDCRGWGGASIMHMENQYMALVLHEEGIFKRLNCVGQCKESLLRDGDGFAACPIH